MASSKSESKKEVSNLACIARILLGPCTDTLRDVLKHRITESDFKIVYKYMDEALIEQEFYSLQLLVSRNDASYSDFDIPLLYFILPPVCIIHFPRPFSSEEKKSLFANITRIYKMHIKYKYFQDGTLEDSVFEQDWEELFQTVKELEKFIGSATANQDAMKKIKNSSMDPDVERVFISNLGQSKRVFQHGIPPVSSFTMPESKKEAQVNASRKIEAYLESSGERILHLEEALGNPAVFDGSCMMEELKAMKIKEPVADDDGSHIKEELDNEKTNIIETGEYASRSIEAYLEEFVIGSLDFEEALGNPAVDEGSGIMEELDSGQTKIMETGDIVDEMTKTTVQGTVKDIVDEMTKTTVQGTVKDIVDEMTKTTVQGTVKGMQHRSSLS